MISIEPSAYQSQQYSAPSTQAAEQNILTTSATSVVVVRGLTFIMRDLGGTSETCLFQLEMERDGENVYLAEEEISIGADESGKATIETLTGGNLVVPRERTLKTQIFRHTNNSNTLFVLSVNWTKHNVPKR